MARDEHVYLVRHGRAEDHHVLGDEGRGLTEEGRQAFRHFVRQELGGLPLSAIATSPLVRAVQTAEILAEACGVLQVLVVPELAYSVASGPGILALCERLGPGFALVGHNPSLAAAVALCSAATPEQEIFRFRKGAIAALEPASSRGGALKAVWLASPGRKKRRF